MDKYFGWLRAFDWLRNNHPDAWAFLVDPLTQNSLILFGVILLCYSAYSWYKSKEPPSRPPGPGSINTTSGPHSPIMGRDFHQHNYGEASRPSEPNKPKGKLNLFFNPHDDRCIRTIDGKNREYRLIVLNETGDSATDVHVQLEDSLPPLKNYPGVRLQVSQLPAGQSSVNLANDAKEYFNLMEYNPYDPDVERAVIHLCHTTHTLPVPIALANYKFRLKAYSAEVTSDEATFYFEQLFSNQSQLTTIPAPNASSKPALELSHVDFEVLPDDPKIQYPTKIRVILRNTTPQWVSVRVPRWIGDVYLQTPQWHVVERESPESNPPWKGVVNGLTPENIPPGSMVRIGLALLTAIPAPELNTLHMARKIGTLTVTATVSGVDQDFSFKI